MYFFLSSETYKRPFGKLLRGSQLDLKCVGFEACSQLELKFMGFEACSQLDLKFMELERFSKTKCSISM